MNEKFFELKKEKQDRMINGAMKVFAQNGYRRASTDDMVKEAGISKGLWFHYFDSKLGLYSFVADYAVKYINLELSSMVNGKTGDYFDICLQIEKIKLSVRKSYPYIPLFLSSILKESDEEARKEIQGYVDSYKEKIALLYAKVDESAFYDTIRMSILNMTVRYTLDGILADAYGEDKFDDNAYKKKITDYLKMMECIVYKQDNE